MRDVRHKLLAHVFQFPELRYVLQHDHHVATRSVLPRYRIEADQDAAPGSAQLDLQLLASSRFSRCLQRFLQRLLPDQFGDAPPLGGALQIEQIALAVFVQISRAARGARRRVIYHLATDAA